jgi:hypothetical protein
MNIPDGYREVGSEELLRDGDLGYDYQKGQWVTIPGNMVDFLNATGLRNFPVARQR